MTVYELIPSVKTPDDFADAKVAAEADLLYKNTLGGMRTATPGSMAYIPVQSFLPIDKLSELEQHAVACTISHSPTSRDYKLNNILQRQFAPNSSLGQVEYILDHSNYSPVYVSEPGKKYCTLMQILQYPFTRGNIHIDPKARDKVLIDPKYYQGEGKIDFDIMVAAQEYGATICETAPLSSIVVKRVYPPETPDKKVDWRGWMSENTITDWHPIGTCAMLPRESGGVVDPTLRVYGTANVRVADASVFPMQISAHIQATVYAVAEKAADMIKVKWTVPARAHL
jgi:choline dehydrogenase-like flavoprotein